MCGADDPVPKISVDRGGVRFSIERCSACAFVYVVNPRETTFDHVQQAPAAVPEKPRHRQIKRVCDHVLVHRLQPGEVLHVVEVGAGWGGLAKVFSRDPAYRYSGFEPSAARAEYCRARGLDVREGLFDARFGGEGADAIVFDNVLEHVEDPRGLVRNAVASLRPGGLLIVIVPNVADVRRFHAGWRDRHHWQPHCHINYFSRRDLSRLFSTHGMEFRFFGPEAVGGLADDVGLLPRVLADRLGVHWLGLNVYAIKPAAP